MNLNSYDDKFDGLEAKLLKSKLKNDKLPPAEERIALIDGVLYEGVKKEFDVLKFMRGESD